MRNKIRFRLLLYFSGSLLAFSLIIGLIFFTTFSRYNMDVYKSELGNRAERMAQSLALFWSGDVGQPGHGMKGHSSGNGAYLRFLDDIAMTDVWIVDSNLRQITRSHGQPSLTYQDLPPEAEDVIAQAMDGKTTFSENFGSLLGTPSISVAKGITLANGEVAGVVLLHEKLKNIRSTTQKSLVILLLSMGAAALISLFIAQRLAEHFTQPLGKMKTAALKISGGDYTATTGVTQEDEIGALAVALDEMAGKLHTAAQESSRLENLRREFVANISHELRTPVTVIRGSLEALCEGVVSAPDMVEEYHRQMFAESLYLERLVSDLLDLALLQNIDFAMEIKTVNLKAIAEDALRGMERLARVKRITLRFNVTGAGFTMDGDYGRLRQMLVIILDNAIKFSPDDSTVDLDLQQVINGIRLCIRDQGCGIPADELPHIFDRFHKRRSEENKSGTGLGLAIAKQIADRHGIFVQVQSEPGRGTELHFFIETRPGILHTSVGDE